MAATARRDRHLARRSSKQRNAQLVFESADLAAYRGRRDAKLFAAAEKLPAATTRMYVAIFSRRSILGSSIR